MDLQKHVRFLFLLIYTALGIAAVIVLLPAAAPFILAFLLSALLDAPVSFLTKKCRVTRPLACAVTLLLFVLLLLAGGIFLLRRLWFEVTLLSSRLPDMLDLFRSIADRAENLLYRLAVALPPDFKAGLDRSLELALEQLSAFLSGFSGALLSWLGAFTSALPRVSLFLVTVFLACYFTTASRPALSAFFHRQIPEKFKPKLESTLKKLKGILGGWIRAQGILLGVTFILLTLGFLLIKANPALLLAAGISLLDALPVFGTGTVLLPWAIWALLSGNFTRAISLLVLYGVIWLTRSMIEPKLIARQSGLPPLAALAAMYFGFTLFGIIGLLLAPPVAMVIRQLHSSGIIRLWK